MHKPLRLLPLLLTGCGASYDAAPTSAFREEEADQKMAAEMPMEGGAAAPGSPAPAAAASRMAEPLGQAEKAGILADANADEAPPADGATGESGAATVRSWFPESFLWAPLVETDAEGRAELSVTVPDTLTTWRVLALGQSREGAQAGVVTSFRSTLLAYVDLAVPPFLYVGDRPGFSVQVANQGASPISANLGFSAEGGTGSGGGRVDVPAWGSLFRATPVAVTRPGQLVLKAELAGYDAVERRVPVRPVGRPVTLRRGGSLGATRELSLLLDPAGRDGELRVEVYPGALSMVASELQNAGSRTTGAWGDAYTFQLVSESAKDLGALGVSAAQLRALRLGSWQRLRSRSLSPDADTLVALVMGLSGAEPGSLEAETGARLSRQLTDLQQPDGLWLANAQGSIDPILVQTAMAAWALGEDTKAPRARARGAFERFRDRLSNPTVAAWALYAGLLEGAEDKKAREQILSHLRTLPDGGRYAPAVGARPDGSRVSDVELTALAALVVEDEAVRADLVTWLLGQYSPVGGFGGGIADFLALRAIRHALGGTIPAEVTIFLEASGAVLARASLDPSQRHQPVRLAGPALPPDTRVTLRSEPAVPGLAFTLEYTSWLPWVQAAPGGLDVVVRPVGDLVAGMESEIEITVVAPASLTGPVAVEVGLPAGVQVAESGLAVALSGDAPFEDQGDKLLFRSVNVAGGVWTRRVRVTPTVPGVLQTGPSQVSSGGESFLRVPSTWVIR